MQNDKKETLIIDMRESTHEDLYALSVLLLNINTLMSSHGFKITVKKTQTPPQPNVAFTYACLV